MFIATSCFIIVLVLLVAIQRINLTRIERGIDSLLCDSANFNSIPSRYGLKLDALKHRIDFLSSTRSFPQQAEVANSPSSTTNEVLERTLREVNQRFIATAKLIITETEENLTSVSKGVAIKLKQHILRNWRYSKDNLESFYKYFGLGEVIVVPFSWQQENITYNGLLWLGYSERQPPTPTERAEATRLALQLAQNCATSVTIGEILKHATSLTSEREKKEEFIKHLSHDMRSPLHNIKTILSMLSEGAEDRKMSLLNIAKANCSRLTSLVDNTLDFSKIQANVLTTNKTEFSLITALDEVIKTFKISAEKTGRNIHFNYSSSDRSCIADEQQIKRVASNLIQNAITHAGGGDVTIEAFETASTLSFVVKDTGCGVNKAHLYSLFQPFSQKGLGLTIAKNLTEINGGSISVTSELEKGTIFTVTLPAAKKLDYLPSNDRELQENPETYNRAFAGSR